MAFTIVISGENEHSLDIEKLPADNTSEKDLALTISNPSISISIAVSAKELIKVINIISQQ